MKNNKIFILLAVLLMTSCLISCRSEKLSNLTNSFFKDIKDKNVVMFIPGFYGSSLYSEKTESQVWMNRKNGLINGKSLVLPGMGFDNSEKYIVGGVLKAVEIIPFIYRKDIYNSFLEKLTKRLQGKYEVVEFSYDWRQEISLSAKRLSVSIDELYARGAKSVSLICHSMGGLVAGYYLRYGGQSLRTAKEDWSGYKKIKNIVVAATPFKGTVTIFKDTFTGLRFGLNTSLLTPQAYSSFPSAYQLMGNNNFFYEKTELDYFQLDLWEKNNWGLLNSEFENFQKNKDLRKLLLANYLDDGKMFHNLMNKKHEEVFPEKKKLLHIVGHKQDSPAMGYWDSESKEFLYEKEDLENKTNQGKISKENFKNFFGDGDGLVTLSSAELPLAIKNSFDVARKYTEFEHAKVLNDTSVLDKIVEYLGSSLSEK